MKNKISAYFLSFALAALVALLVLLALFEGINREVERQERIVCTGGECVYYED